MQNISSGFLALKVPIFYEAEAGRENLIGTFAEHSRILSSDFFFPNWKDVLAGQGLFFSLFPSLQLFPNGLDFHTESFLIV